MPEPINTTETNNEPNLEQFNESAPASGTQPAAKQENGEQAPAAKASEQQAASQQTAQQPSQAQQQAQQAVTENNAQQAQQPADPYANLLDGVRMPTGMHVDEELLGGLKEVAAKHKLPIEAVKELVQLDLNNSAADRMFEDKLIADAQNRWAAENKAKYGDNLKNVETNCSRVLAELDKDGKFKELLATAGVSSHPATLGFLKAIGEVVLEKPSVNPNATVSTEREVELEDFN